MEKEIKTDNDFNLIRLKNYKLKLRIANACIIFGALFFLASLWLITEYKNKNRYALSIGESAVLIIDTRTGDIYNPRNSKKYSIQEFTEGKLIENGN